jgi:hypothetical protein
MVYAPDVLREAVEEADLLTHSGGTLDEIRPIIRLASDALHAGDGEVPDEAVRDCLHPTRWDRLGVS